MTYAESQNKEPFNWREVLIDILEGSEAASPAFCGALRERACEWVTCACGQLCARIARDEAGAPEDPELRGLGQLFAIDIKFKDWTSALNRLNAIDRRHAELLALLP